MEADYVHLPLNQEVRSISGAYVLEKEGTLKSGDREALYAVGTGVADSTCCGFGGMRYALVPGYVVSSAYRTNQDGLSVSRVARVPAKEREALAAAIRRKEGVFDVVFL
ncbi:MAG: hypothetical protein JRI97_05840 [Deltaproteobacteria bacterium]|nr:hypothetical protein [Deltaproteobacteria bacterium]